MLVADVGHEPGRIGPVDLAHELAHGIRCAGTEAVEQPVLLGDDALVPSGGRLRDAGDLEQAVDALTESSPLVVMRITSGAASTSASLVIGVNGLSRPIAVPASSPPAASIIESAPDPLPPSRYTPAAPRR